MLSDEQRANAGHEIAHGLIAALRGHGVTTISAIARGPSRGRCVTRPPQGRDHFRTQIEQAEISLAGPIACPSAGDGEDLARAQQIVRDLTGSDREAAALLAWLEIRVEEDLEHPAVRKAEAELLRRLEAAGGEIDLAHAARADVPPLISLVVEPIINVTVPPQQPPEVTVNVEAPDKTIRFERDGAGQIAAATTAPA